MTPRFQDVKIFRFLGSFWFFENPLIIILDCYTAVDPRDEKSWKSLEEKLIKHFVGGDTAEGNVLKYVVDGGRCIWKY